LHISLARRIGKWTHAIGPPGGRFGKRDRTAPQGGRRSTRIVRSACMTACALRKVDDDSRAAVTALRRCRARPLNVIVAGSDCAMGRRICRVHCQGVASSGNSTHRDRRRASAEGPRKNRGECDCPASIRIRTPLIGPAQSSLAKYKFLTIGAGCGTVVYTVEGRQIAPFAAEMR
jgi:hypothetical protein